MNLSPRAEQPLEIQHARRSHYAQFLDRYPLATLDCMVAQYAASL
jgi:hypothetical protein